MWCGELIQEEGVVVGFGIEWCISKPGRVNGGLVMTEVEFDH